MSIGRYLLDRNADVWISEDRKVVYVRNPRAASLSVIRRLKALCPDLERGDTRRMVRWLGSVSDKAMSNFWVFTMARNTWDRVVSAYSYLKEAGIIDIEFKDFIGMLCNGELGEDEMLLLKDQRDCFMKDGRVFADYVGRMDHMGLACRRVKDRCGFWEGGLAVSNKTKHGPFQEYYDEELARIVFEYYKDDIEILQCEIPGMDGVIPPMEWKKIERQKL